MIPPIIITITTFILFIICSIIILFKTKVKSVTFFIYSLAILFPFLSFNLKNGINITLFQGLFFVILFKNPEMVFKKKDNRIFLIFIFFLSLLFTSIISIDFKKSSWGLLRLTSYLLFYIWMNNYLKKEGDKRLYKYFIITLSSSIVFILGQLIWGNIFTLYSSVNINTITNESFRYFSEFADPQTYGQYLVMTFFALIYFSKNNYGSTKINILLTIIVIACLILTMSKAPIIALAIGCLLISLKNTKYKIIIACSILFISFTDIVNIEPIFNQDYEFIKRFSVINESAQNRQLFWNDAIEVFNNHPLGIGFGNYQSIIPHYNSNNYFIWNDEIVYPSQAESGYLHLLVSIGSISSLILICLLAKPFFLSYKSYRIKNYYSPIFYSVLAFLISFMTVYSLDETKVAVTFFILLALYNYSKTIILKPSIINKDNL